MERRALRRNLAADSVAGLTVALVAIPKTMAFATIAGLPPVAGLYTAVVMELVSTLLSRSPRLVVGPSITASSLTFAVLSTAVIGDHEQWPAAAGALALLVGLFIVCGALLNIGRFLRFVSRSVIVGLMVGSAILIVGSQLPAMFGLPAPRDPMLVRILWETAAQLPGTSLAALAMSCGTFALVLLFGLLDKRFPAAFLALVISGFVQWGLSGADVATGLRTIGELRWVWPTSLTPPFLGPYRTDFFVGAGALALVGIIQTLTIAKAMAIRSGEQIDPRRELMAVGLANAAAGMLHGFPGSGSFARSALSEMAGARTRMSSVVSALATIAIVSAGAALTKHITSAAIAGLLLATVISMVDWSEFVGVMRRDRHDRIVLGTIIVCVFFLPIHWAILLGLAVSIASFLRRVSVLHLAEMVRIEGGLFRERDLDEKTGTCAITMLQVEGPLFFAHADELAEQLRTVFSRGPRVVIVRMRRTHHLDFSVIASLQRVFRDYAQQGGHVIICGLSHGMRKAILHSPLGEIIGPDCLLESGHDVFGSAHLAIGLAQSIVDVADDARPRFRGESRASADLPRQDAEIAKSN